MDIDWLEDYLALRELGTFTAAAERRNLSQPAFSRRIQAFEAWLGVTLIDRSSRPHKFTSIATEHDAKLHRFLNQLYDLRSQLRGEQARTSRLRVTVQHSLSIALFPQIVELLRQNGFQPVYDLNCSDRAQCIEMLLRDNSDLLICHETENLRAKIPTTIGTKLFSCKDEMILVGLPNAPFAKGRLTEGRKLQLLTYPQSSFFGAIVLDYAMPLIVNRFDVETICISAFSSALRAMVLAGFGVAWLPRSLIGPDLKAGLLVAFDPGRLCYPLDVAVYVRHANNKHQNTSFWKYLSKINPESLVI